MLQAQQHRFSRLRATGAKPISLRCSASAPAQVLTTTQQVAEAPVVELDVEALHKRLEARAMAMIQLEEQEVANRTKVKITLKQKVGLGECWKVVGSCPELGNNLPEVAPFMQWNNGDVWTYEGKIRPGAFTFKAVLRKPDGQYLSETGEPRILEVPFGEAVKSVELVQIKFP